MEASDTPAVQSALEARVEALVIDFDDTFSPTPDNVRAGYANLHRAAQSDVPLLVRPRALYAIEPSLDFGGPGIASLCDLSAALTAQRGRVPHLYLPKLENVVQAQFWAEAMSLAEEALNLPPFTVKTCLQIETFTGLVKADHLLYTLHRRTYGLNAGRWDYVFSLLKNTAAQRKGPVPPRADLTMDVPAMQAYARNIVQVCHQRGAEAIGGTAALAPDPQHPEVALRAVQADKQREAVQGFTAAWAGLPELLAPARAGLTGSASQQDQTGPISTAPVGTAELVDLPAVHRLALHEVRDAISLALDVFAAWFEGRGVIVRQGRIEDTATAELARTQVWQWVRCAAPLDDSSTLTPERYLQERAALRRGQDQGQDQASALLAERLLDALVLADRCPAYFPRLAQTLSLHLHSHESLPEGTPP